MASPHPIALNLALIVHRLLTHPRGWRVDDLQHELQIADRTYRKYRALLTESFWPFLRDGQPLVQEVEEGEARWLRLVAPLSTPDEVTEIASALAAYALARQVVPALGVGDGGNVIEEDFQAFWHRLRLRHRHPFLRGAARHLDRWFLYRPEDGAQGPPPPEVVGRLLEGLVTSRRLALRYDESGRGPRDLVVEPLTLVLSGGRLHLFAHRVGTPGVHGFVVARVLAAEVTDEPYDYPPPDEYDPTRIAHGRLGGE